MTILNSGTRNQYTATSGQTSFVYNFEIFEQGDIVVYQDATLLSIGTHYTVTGAGSDLGGTIVLVTGAASGDIMTIFRDTSPERLTDYQNSGSFLADEVNSDFDRIWAVIQEINTSQTRTLKLDDSDLSTSGLTLPYPVSQNYLRWNTALTGLENVDLASFGSPTTSDLVSLAIDGTTTNVSEYLNEQFVDDYTELEANMSAGAYGIGAVVYVRSTGGPAGIIEAEGANVADGGYIRVAGGQAWKRRLDGGVGQLSWYEPVLGGTTDNSVFIESCIANTGGCIIDVDGVVGWSHVDVDIDNAIIKTAPGSSLKMIETANPYGFDCSGTSGVEIDIKVDGDKSAFTYAENTSSNATLNTRSRYAAVFASGINDAILHVDSSNMYSAAIYLTGGIIDEKATSRNIVISGRCVDSYFEMFKIIKCGDVVVDVYTKNNTNSFVSSALVGNGAITTVCDNVTILDSCYFGACDGTGIKIESINGLHTFGSILCEDNMFNGIHIQESGAEQGDISNHNGKVVLNGPTMRRSANAALSCESSTVNAPRNVSGWIVDENCARMSVFCSGSDFNLKIITRGVGTADLNGEYRNRSAVFIANESGEPINNLKFELDYYQYNSAATINMAVVDIGSISNPACVVDGVTISGVVRDHVFRGVFGQNNVQANNVNIEGLSFTRTDYRTGTAQAGTSTTITLDASASSDNSAYESKVVGITSGTGSGQNRSISSYVGATKVATVSAAWTVTPDATSVFHIVESGVATYDVYTTNNKPNLLWSVKDCTSGTGMLVRLTGLNSFADGQNITPTWPNSNLGWNSALQYYVLIDGGRSSFIDRSGRMNTYATSIPTYDADKHSNKDIAWNTASSTPEYWYLANTTWTASN